MTFEWSTMCLSWSPMQPLCKCSQEVWSMFKTLPSPEKLSIIQSWFWAQIVLILVRRRFLEISNFSDVWWSSPTLANASVGRSVRNQNITSASEIGRQILQIRGQMQPQRKFPSRDELNSTADLPRGKNSLFRLYALSILFVQRCPILHLQVLLGRFTRS